MLLTQETQFPLLVETTNTNTTCSNSNDTDNNSNNKNNSTVCASMMMIITPSTPAMSFDWSDFPVVQRDQPFTAVSYSRKGGDVATGPHSIITNKNKASTEAGNSDSTATTTTTTTAPLHKLATNHSTSVQNEKRMEHNCDEIESVPSDSDFSTSSTASNTSFDSDTSNTWWSTTTASTSSSSSCISSSKKTAIKASRGILKKARLQSSTTTTTTTTTAHQVSFNPQLQVRTHTIILGDHPCCGPLALELGWEHNGMDLVSLEQHESWKREQNQQQHQHPSSSSSCFKQRQQHRGEARRRSYFERRQVLKEVCGLTDADIRRSTLQKAVPSSMDLLQMQMSSSSSPSSSSPRRTLIAIQS